MTRYVWYRSRVWLDTGMRNWLGKALLWRLPDDGSGATVDPSKTEPVVGEQLAALLRWRWS